MLVIKNFVISEDNFFAQIEENKKKPKKAGGFTAPSKSNGETEKQQRTKSKAQAINTPFPLNIFPTFAAWQPLLLDFLEE